jgi:hypothetical protein
MSETKVAPEVLDWILKRRGRKQTLKILEKVRSLPYVHSVTMSSDILFQSPIVETNEIHLGPFNFGAHRILMHPSKCREIFTRINSYLPYEHASGHFCLGRDFYSLYHEAMLRRDLYTAIVAVRLWMTNYNSGGCMNSIEDFLRTTMGRDNFRTAFISLVPRDDAKWIQSIFGSKMTVYCQKHNDNEGGMITEYVEVKLK